MGGPPSAPLSDPGYIARVNAICETSNRSLEDLPDPDPTDLQGQADVLERAVAVLADRMARIRALPSPEADRARVQDLYRRVDLVADLGQRAAAAARAGDAEGLETIMTDADDASIDANEQLLAAGLDECSTAYLP